MSVDPRHLLLVGAGPGLGPAMARRFAREGYRLTRVAAPGPPGVVIYSAALAERASC